MAGRVEASLVKIPARPAAGPQMGEERAIRQEDCSEDTLGTGVLVLTDRRIAFDKTQSRMLDLSKRFGETVLDIPLRDVVRVWNEGLFIKKVCFSARVGSEERTYKFGVMGTGSWADSIMGAMGAQ